MYKFLQTHGKKLMAIFSVFLMIAFALPSAYKYAGGSGANQVVGRIGEKGQAKIYASDVYQAKRSWDTLKNLPWRNNTPQALRLGAEAAAQIDKNPLMFLLLQKEAQQMGVAVSKDQLQTELVNTPGFQTADDERRIATEKAVADLLLIIQGFQRGASTIKVSEPMVKHELAMLGQTVTVKVIEFPASKYADKVPAPTAEQLKAQFEKYADVIKGSSAGGATDNPFGFGYKYPNRLKLQYIALPRETVRKAVEASKSPYEWRVEAQKFYLQNPSRFPSTQEAPKDDLSLGGGGVKRTPTTRPFAEVEPLIKDQLIDAETAKKTATILERINTALAGDWVAYHNSPAGATTAPSSLRVPYDSFEYLQKLAASIQNDFKVQPTVVSLADKWLTGDDVAKLPGVGTAVASLDAGEIPVPYYLMARTAAFMPAERRDEPGLLQVLEPTRPLRDSAQTTYVARITAADPTHRPAALAEVEPAVRADVITAKAYELSKAEAAKLLEQARQKGSLKDATGGTGVLAVGPLSNRNDESVPVLSLSASAGATQFIAGAFELLTAPTTRPGGKPVRVIELPREGRLFVAELGNVDATFTPRSLAFDRARVHEIVGNRLEQDFIRNWFNYPSLTSRLNFVPDPGYKESDSPAPPPPAAPPIF